MVWRKPRIKNRPDKSGAQKEHKPLPKFGHPALRQNVEIWRFGTRQSNLALPNVNASYRKITKLANDNYFYYIKMM